MSALKPFFFGLLMALATANSARAEACGGTYQVKHGDTLSEIAQHQVGTVFALHQLIAANPGKIGHNLNQLHVGVVLDLPCRVPMGGFSSDTPFNWSVMPGAREVVPLVQANQTQILDIRSMDAIKNGVIPGAIHVPYKAWQTASGTAPNEAMLAEIYGLSGLRLDQPIVIVNGRATVDDLGAAAFVYWLLKSSGAQQLAILRNGHQSWVNADQPLDAVPALMDPYEMDVTLAYTWRADADDIKAITQGTKVGTVLRASPRALPIDVTAAPVQPLLATLSGEVDLNDGVSAILDHLSTYAPGWQAGPVISMCEELELGALHWFLASELAGQPDMRFYPKEISSSVFVSG